MNVHAREFATGAVAPTAHRPAPATVIAAAHEATRKVAPVWPLKHFVAVNPYLGLVDRPFIEVAGIMAEAAGARTLMPAAFYLEATRTGRIADADIAAALAAAGRPAGEGDVAEVKRRAAAEDDTLPPPLPTFADVVSEVTGSDVAALVVDRVSAFAAGHFDEGQALWPMPGRELSPFASWRLFAAMDRTAGARGIRGVPDFVNGLSPCAGNALTAAIDVLGIPAEALPRYFHRLVMTVGGWAAYARYRVWETELRGGSDDTLFELLVIRAAWDAALARAFAGNAEVAAAWQGALARLAEPRPALAFPTPAATTLHAAYEIAFQRTLVAGIGSSAAAAPAARPDVQAAFCIDVRSEIFRRALEATSDRVETLGFAGFFGVPLEVVPFGEQHGGAHCPVLFTPAIVVPERCEGDGCDEAQAKAALATHRGTKKAWTWFKNAAVSSFAFVETVGLAYAAKLAGDALGGAPRKREGIDPAVAKGIAPSMAPGEIAGRATGIEPNQRVEIAAAVLTAMSLTKGFGRIVLLAGHGSTTTNNPHATGLDCGACGGHTGEANARVTAAILNDPHVRRGLAARGLPVPEDTFFLAGLHDTTTDEVHLLGTDAVPPTHAGDLERLKAWLREAGAKARRERAKLLGLSPAADDLDEAVLGRSQDWSQVRPEWGLAGCAAFVAAPRRVAPGACRSRAAPFFHTYDWRADRGLRPFLELIHDSTGGGRWKLDQPPVLRIHPVDNPRPRSWQQGVCTTSSCHPRAPGRNAGDLRTGLALLSVSPRRRSASSTADAASNRDRGRPVEAMNTVICQEREMVLHLPRQRMAASVGHRRGRADRDEIRGAMELAAGCRAIGAGEGGRVGSRWNTCEASRIGGDRASSARRCRRRGTPVSFSRGGKDFDRSLPTSPSGPFWPFAARRCRSFTVYSTWEFRDVCAFRDSFAQKNGFPPRGLRQRGGAGRPVITWHHSPFDHAYRYTSLDCAPDALKQALDEGGYDVILRRRPARRGGGAGRKVSRIVSVAEPGTWRPRRQRPGSSLVPLQLGRMDKGQTLRGLFPSPTGPTIDLCTYIMARAYEARAAYYAAPRPGLDQGTARSSWWTIPTPCAGRTVKKAETKVVALPDAGLLWPVTGRRGIACDQLPRHPEGRRSRAGRPRRSAGAFSDEGLAGEAEAPPATF